MSAWLRQAKDFPNRSEHCKTCIPKHQERIEARQKSRDLSGWADLESKERRQRDGEEEEPKQFR